MPEAAPLRAHVRTVVLTVTLREAELARLVREAAAGGDAPPSAAAPAGPEVKVSAKEAGMETADELARCVMAQENGHPPRLEEEPSTADVLAALDQLRRDPPRAVAISALSLAGRLGGGDDGSRHVKGKTFSHVRGERREDEDRILDKYFNAVGQAGAYPAGADVIAERCDEGSGVREDGADSDTILMARRRAVTDAKVAFREFKSTNGLSAAERASFNDGVVRYLNDALRLGGTLTSAIVGATKACARIHDDSKSAASEYSTKPEVERRRTSTVPAGGRTKRFVWDSDDDSDDGSPRRSAAPRPRPRDRDRDRDRGRDRGRDRDRDRGRDRRPSGGGVKDRGSKRDRSPPDAPRGICYKWAKAQITRRRGDECKESSADCRFEHKFKKGDRQWAEDKYGR